MHVGIVSTLLECPLEESISVQGCTYSRFRKTTPMALMHYNNHLSFIFSVFEKGQPGRFSIFRDVRTIQIQTRWNVPGFGWKRDKLKKGKLWEGLERWGMYSRPWMHNPFQILTSPARCLFLMCYVHRPYPSNSAIRWHYNSSCMSINLLALRLKSWLSMGAL